MYNIKNVSGPLAGGGEAHSLSFCRFTTPSRKLSLQTASMHSESPHNPNFLETNYLIKKTKRDGDRRIERHTLSFPYPINHSCLHLGQTDFFQALGT